MFGLGMPEILLILAIALIIIGPKKLPDLAKTLGKAMGEFKNAAQDFKNSINIESSIADMDPSADEIQKNIKEANKELAKDADQKADKDSSTADADFIEKNDPAEDEGNPKDKTHDSTDNGASNQDPKKDIEKE
jgi:Tat protein translocase TatB subunit